MECAKRFSSLICTLVLTACSGGGGGSAEAPPPPPPPPGPMPAVPFVNTANVGSPLGTNLANIASFASEYPFANLFKHARAWISGTSRSFADGGKLELDRDGYVVALKPDQVARTPLFDTVPRDLALNGRRFVLRFDGDGDIGVQVGAMVVSQAPGRIVIQLGTGGSGDDAGILINLTRTNPANPLRNIRLSPEGGICRSNPLAAVAAAGACMGADFVSFEEAATAGEILFNPEFLDSIKTYGGVRFMDWMRTNGSTVATFAARPKPSDAVWSTPAGVPLEAIITLANLMDVDPWINIPHLADDAYVTQTATMLRDGLEPARRVHVEYSNETWNTIFAQATYVQDRGEALGLHLPGGRFTGGLRFYSKRSQEIFDIFDAVYGASRASRVRRVLATQASGTFLTRTILAFGDAAAKCDVFAIAPYFSLNVVGESSAAQVKAAGVDGVFAWLATGTPPLGPGNLANVDRIVAEQKALVAGFGIPLAAYEGGQHFVGFGPFQNDAQINEIFDAVNRDPRMKAVYLQYLGIWRSHTAEPLWHFLNTERWSKFGRWGSRQVSSEPRAAAPKFDALQTYIETRPLPR